MQVFLSLKSQIMYLSLDLIPNFLRDFNNLCLLKNDLGLHFFLHQAEEGKYLLFKDFLTFIFGFNLCQSLAS